MDIYSFFIEVLGISDENVIRAGLEVMSICQFNKGYLLFEQEGTFDKIYLLVEGTMRGYYLDSKGKEVTDCFAYKCGDPIIPVTDDYGVPLNSIEALTPITALCIQVTAFDQLMQKHLSLARLAYNLSTKATQRHWYSKQARYSFSVKERYQWFLENYSEIVDIVSDKHIASFIGTTPESISRVRRTLREEQNVV